MTDLFDEILQFVLGSFSAKLAIAVLIVCIETRVISAQKYRSRSTTIPPYWIPYIGHSLHIFYDWRGFITSNAKYIHKGSLTPYVLGRKPTIIVSPALTEQLLTHSQLSSTESNSSPHFHLFKNVFGAPSSSHNLYHSPSLSLLDLVPPISLPSKSVTKLISSRLPDLISFNSYIVDQFPWERPCSPQTAKHPYSLDETRQAARVPLVTLVTQFIGHVISHAVMGADFMEQYPQFLDDLADLDQGYKYLALGMPRWIPPMSVAAAYIARKRLLAILSGVEAALDKSDDGGEPEEPWGDVVEDLSDGLKESSRRLRESGASVEFRASVKLAALWSLYAQTTTLAAWMLIHIWNSGDLWAKIKSETSISTSVKSGAKIMAFSGSSSVEIDEATLKSSSPLLLACLAECAKRYLCPQYVVKTMAGITLATGSKDEMQLEKGSLVVSGILPTELDSNAFDVMAASDRGNDLPPTPSTMAVEYNSKPGESIINIVLPTVAGIIAFWEIIPAKASSMTIPTPSTASPCARPASSFMIYLTQAITDT